MTGSLSSLFPASTVQRVRYTGTLKGGYCERVRELIAAASAVE